MQESVEKIPLTSLADTDFLAKRVAEVAFPGMILGLRGEVGAGKTTFTQHLLRYLGAETMHCASPTFTIINEVKCRRFNVLHCDFYRLSDIAEMEEIGGLELFYQENVAIIEWIDQVPLAELLPPEKVFILEFQHVSEDKRAVLLPIRLWQAKK